MERFEKLRTLGRGAQGSVILVRRKTDGSEMVLKRIFVDEHSGEEREEVTNEIKVLSMLNHPNIVSYYGSFHSDGDSIINVVMEYADGGSLFHHIQRAKAPFPESQILSYAVQLLLALQHMHSKNILHRDMKSRNIFLTKSGTIKLGDFGLSKIMNSNASFASSAVGTPYYMSPELCRGKPYNQKSDIWAVGCVLYELTTFRHAFDATNLPALVMNIVSRDYDPVREQSYSKEFKEFIGLCLRKIPEERPGVDALLEMPLTRGIAEEARRDAQRMVAEMANTFSTREKPFFDMGIVETALSRVSLDSGGASASTSGAGGDRRDVLLTLLREVEDSNFDRFISLMRDKLDVRDRVHFKVPYFKCFTGTAFVDYIIGTLNLSSRDDAVFVGQRWMDTGVFYHVTRNDPFSDGDGALFRFKQDEVGSILNMKQQCGDGVTPAKNCVIALEDTMSGIYARFHGEDGRNRGAGAATSIDYEALALSDEFKTYCGIATSLQRLDLDHLSFNEKMSFFINAYNALVIHAFVVIGPPSTAAHRLHFYNHTCLCIGGDVYSLAHIRHGILRANRKPCNAFRPLLDRVGHAAKLRHAQDMLFDPRVHFALVDGSVSCPALRVYSASSLDAHLSAAARHFVAREVQVGDESSAEEATVMDGKMTKTKTTRDGVKRSAVVLLPPVFELYYSDFGSTDEELLRWLQPLLPAHGDGARLAALLDQGPGAYRIKYRRFNWQLNKSMKKPPPPPPGLRHGHGFGKQQQQHYVANVQPMSPGSDRLARGQGGGIHGRSDMPPLPPHPLPAVPRPKPKPATMH